MLYKADLHIHTVLSPCGDIDMSPSMIVDQALIKGLRIIGITDHNSTRNAIVTRDIGKENGIYVLMGAEVTSKEEVHCLCFMPDDEKLKLFQKYIDENISKKKNNVTFFGNQLVVDERENILEEEHLLLIQSISKPLNNISLKVKELGGIFIPAHIDANRHSISSQLGFISDDLEYDALEVVAKDNKCGMAIPKDKMIISSSDAHYLEDIGKRFTELNLEVVDFNSIKNSLSL